MSNIIRHVGHDHLGHKVIVVFREIPDDTEHCLVVQSSTLPDMYHDNLMNVIESLEAQQTINLYEVLNRRVFGDGSQMLRALHDRGLLKKMSVDQISLVPMPNRKLPLRDANAAIAGDTPVAPTPVVAPEQPPTTKVEVPGSADDSKMQAQMLIEQARLLENDAKRIRDQAYSLDPSLKAGGRPPSKKRTAKKKTAK